MIGVCELVKPLKLILCLLSQSYPCDRSRELYVCGKGADGDEVSTFNRLLIIAGFSGEFFVGLGSPRLASGKSRRRV